jgi:hypothetical protein
LIRITTCLPSAKEQRESKQVLKNQLAIAEKYTIKNARNIIQDVVAAIDFWRQAANDLHLPPGIADSIRKSFVTF